MKGENVKLKDMLMYDDEERIVWLQIWSNKKASHIKLPVKEALSLYGNCEIISTVRGHGVIEQLSIRGLV